MRSPSVVPGFDADVYLVLDDFGQLGRAYREVDEEGADRQTVIRQLLEGQFNNPVRIVCFNTCQGWSRDVTEDIAREIKEWSARKGEPLSEGLRNFIDWQLEVAIATAGHPRVRSGHEKRNRFRRQQGNGLRLVGRAGSI